MRNTDQAKSLQLVLVGHDADWCPALVYFRLLNYDPCLHDQTANLLNPINKSADKGERIP
jgi:hypothetical protein